MTAPRRRRYAALHDDAYRALVDEGAVCWDRTDFDAFTLRPFLERALPLLLRGGVGVRRALDVGCGTGPVACFLAARGFDVVGVDVSPTAVAQARQRAAERALAAVFVACDVADFADPDGFDVIVDSHCLHCVVYDDERRRFFATLRGLLRAGGVLLVETMARHPGLRFDSGVLDDDGVWWRRSDDGDADDARDIGGLRHQPARRLLDEAALDAEVGAAGFEVVWRQTLAEERPGDPRNFQAILRRSAL